jgi:hypothetical protein
MTAGAATGADQAMLEVLQSPGPAVWVHDRPIEPPPPPLDQLRPDVQVRPPGKISPSVARDPAPEDRASVEAERSTPPLLQVYRRSALRDRAVRPHLPVASVVIAEGLPDLRGVRRLFPAATIMRLPPL